MGQVVSVKVAIVSDFREGYDVALEACYARAFKQLGADVNCVSVRQLVGECRGKVGLLTASARAMIAEPRVRAEVFAGSPDVVILVKATSVLARSVRRWRSAGLQVINVFPDNPFECMAIGGAGASLLEQFRACNRVFVHDRFAAGQLRQLGVQSEFLTFARDPSLHHPYVAVDPVPHPPNIAFVGNPDPERVTFLRAVADLGLGLWGHWDWANLSATDPLVRCVRGPDQMGHDMVRCLRGALLSINILRKSQKTAHNMRTFESPACGVCTLSERTNGVLELMKDGVEVVTFSTPVELRGAAIALLSDQSRRHAVADAGWARVQPETYEARAKELMSYMT